MSNGLRDTSKQRACYLPLLALLAFLLLPAWTAHAQTLNATFNTASDVPVTASGYTASGTINITLNFAPATGTTLTVVNNTSLNFIQGAFSNLAQGQLVTLSFNGANYHFIANYYGGTGNDLVLLWANTRLVAWGQGGFALGNNSSNIPSLIPEPVMTTGTPLAGKFILATATSGDFSLALCSDGTLASWGNNFWGELGNGTTLTSSGVPTAVTTSGVLAGKTVVAISVGGSFALVLCSDGTVAAWGYNSSGQLGNGSTTNSSVPVLVDNSADSALFGKTVVAISTNSNFSTALCSDGTVVAWGYNADGELGNGGTTNSSVPVLVSTTGTALAGKSVIALSAGESQTLALCSDGSVAAWGQNFFGQLGNGDTSGTSSSVPVAVNTAAGSALFGKTVVAISAGGDFCVAQCSDGSLAAWGENQYGELGNGSSAFGSYLPVPVSISGTALSGKRITALQAGGDFSLALCSDGTMAAWGRGNVGELGNNSTTVINNLPVAVSTASLLPGEQFCAVASCLSPDQSMALVAEPTCAQISVQVPAGATVASNSFANFGSTSVGVGVPLTFTVLNNGSAPLNITGVTIDGVNSSDFSVTTAPASSVAVGSSTTLTVTFTPAAVFDGCAVLHIASSDPVTPSYNVNLTGGSIGTLTATFNSATSVPLTVPSFTATGSTVNLSLNFAPAPGTNLTVVKNTGAGYINGAFTNLAQGQVVTFNFGGVISSFVANYFGGTGHDLVLQWAGVRPVGWGTNFGSEVGTGKGSTAILVPVALDTASGSALAGKILFSMAGGNDFGLVLCSDGTMVSWGSNLGGDLGNGGTLASPTPVAVSTTGVLAGKTVIAIATGTEHSLALCSDGTLVAWGDNNDGQLGNGANTNSNVPVLVTVAGTPLAGRTIIAIASGDSTSMALCSDGTLAAWGDNSNGQLGNNSEIDSNVPVAVITAGTVLGGKTIVAMSCSSSHALALCSDGTLAAWGSSGFGELGTGSGSLTGNLLPVPVNTAAGSALAGKTVTAISAGSAYSLALCSDGTVAAWGSNASGDLGNNSNTDSGLPVAVITSGTALAGKTVVAINASQGFSLALCSDGSAAAWGSNGSGQLGNNSTAGSLVPVAVSTTNLVTREIFVQAVSARDAQHNLALVAGPPAPQIALQQPAGTGLSNGATVNFGSSSVGTQTPLTFTVLNNGTAPLTISNVTIDGVNSADFAVTTSPAPSVAVGSSTTMTVTFTPSAVLDRNAALHIFSNDPKTPTFNVALTGVVPGALAITYNSASTVPYTGSTATPTGSTVSFALNYAPTPGTNLMVLQLTSPGFIQGTFSNLAQGQLVTMTFGGINYSFVANYYGGTGNDLVLQWADNRVFAWGQGSTGQLGNNNIVQSTVPVGVSTLGVLPGKTVLATAAGGQHSLAVCADGTVASWGFNNLGQLGNNSFTESNVPVSVSTTGTALAGETVLAVSAGMVHSLALCADGTIAAWGGGNNGQLGNNNSGNSLVPVKVLSLTGKTVVAISAGGLHNLALCSDGTLVAWGAGNNGQLGNGGLTNKMTPVAVNNSGVLSGKTVVAIAAGGLHSLALCSDGTLAAWGINTNGQLGNNSNTQSTTPVAVLATGVLSGKTVVAIAAGGNHSLALCSDGSIAAWGLNNSGELGNNSTTQSNVPVSVVTSGVLSTKTVTSISAGLFHSLAFCSDGTAVAWGADSNGQLGNNNATNSLVPVLVKTTSLVSGEAFVGTITTGQSANHSLGIVAEPPSPVLSPIAATSITVTSATLNYAVNPGGNSTTASFQYGLTTSYGTTSTGQSLGSGIAPLRINLPLTGLSPHTTYHYRVTATNVAGSPNGADVSFTTKDTTPVANADTVNNVSGPVTIPVLSNDTDADGDTLTVTVVSQGTYGSVTTDGTSVTYTPGSSFIVAGSDTFSYTISDGFGGTAGATVTVNAAGFGTWCAQTFGANAGNPAIAGDNADPNGNGIPNLLEYALHGDAVGNSTGNSILPQVSANPSTGTLQLSFTRYQDRTDISLIVQANDSLTGTWTNLAQSVDGAPFTVITTGAIVNESGTGNAISVTVGDLYQTTDPNHPQRFMRLMVTRP